MPVDLRNVVDLICLVYHEARNVRHPIRSGKLDDTAKYAKLVSLPKNRNDAWQEMSALRSRAVQSGTVKAAREAFEQSFGVSLSNLETLYELPIWRHSAYGGNKWTGIAKAVNNLVKAMQCGDSERADELYQAVISMCHNTGRVADKLRALSG